MCPREKFVDFAKLKDLVPASHALGYFEDTFFYDFLEKQTNKTTKKIFGI